MPTTRQPTGGTSEAAGRGPGAHQPQPPGSTDEGAGPVPAPVPAPEGRPGVAGRAVLARAGRRPMLGYQCVTESAALFMQVTGQVPGKSESAPFTRYVRNLKGPDFAAS